MNGGAGKARVSGRSRVALQVGQFAIAGVVALGVVGLGTTIASRRVGEREAITEARSTAVARAQGLVTPVLTDGLLEGDPAAVAAVGRAVEQGVLDDSLVRVKLWAPSGTIVYSDEELLIGSSYELGADEVASLQTGAIEADVSDLTKPENRYEAPFGRLLEIYLPVYTPSGQPVLFEAYFLYDAVEASGSRLWGAFAPVALGALVILEAVQLTLAWSLAHRLRLRIDERERLLQHALDASEVERRTIAADLHDGVVQDLAGVAYGLSGRARTLAARDPANADVLESSAEQVRHSIKALRSLLVEIYPPNLEVEGLEPAVSDLIETAVSRGLAVELDAGLLEATVPFPVAQLLYRATQESLRNVIRHAEATSVRVQLTCDGHVARVVVTDDGRGYEPSESATHEADGHLGLKGLAGLVDDAGGMMRVASKPGEGTSVEVEVPIG